MSSLINTFDKVDRPTLANMTTAHNEREKLRSSHTAPNIKQFDNCVRSGNPKISLEGNQVDNEEELNVEGPTEKRGRSASTFVYGSQTPSDYLSPQRRSTGGTTNLNSFTQSARRNVDVHHRPSIISITAAHNPIAQLSSEYMRLVGYNKPLRKLLSKGKAEQESLINKKQTSVHIEDTKLISDIHNWSDGVGQNNNKSAIIQYDRHVAKKSVDIANAEFRHKLGERKRIHFKRSRYCQFCLALVMMGLTLTVIEAELCAHNYINKVSIAVKC